MDTTANTILSIKRVFIFFSCMVGRFGETGLPSGDTESLLVESVDYTQVGAILFKRAGPGCLLCPLTLVAP
jgi:hypothetical protein